MGQTLKSSKGICNYFLNVGKLTSNVGGKKNTGGRPSSLGGNAVKMLPIQSRKASEGKRALDYDEGAHEPESKSGESGEEKKHVAPGNRGGDAPHHEMGKKRGRKRGCFL